MPLVARRDAVVLFTLLLFVLPCGAEPIARSPKLPETTPWNLSTLGETPTFEWVDDKGPVRSLLYAGEPYDGKPTRVFAYYASPATLGKSPSDKKFPGMVLIHGGGGTAFREWAELWAKRGYAAIAMDLAGYRPNEGQDAHKIANRTRLNDGGPNQGDVEKFGSIDNPVTEQWPYHAVASAVRGHSLMRSFPDVDATKIGVTGISWGGYLTCIVAGVDNRFRAAVPVYGCGFLHDNSAWLDRFAKMTPAQRERWIELWDPSKYLPAVSMPIFFVNGTNDFAYPLDSYMKCYDLVPGAKNIRVTVNMPHGHPPGWAPQEIGMFVDEHLLEGRKLPVLGDAELVDGSKVHVSLQGGIEAKEAALHYTTDEGPINKRMWKTVSAMIDGSAITAKLLDPAAKAWFVTVTDDRGAIVSSRVVIR
jgi:dienelactone hydrolase